MRGQQSSTRFRQRKLNTKSNLRILREADLDPGHVELNVNGVNGGLDEGVDGAAANLPKVESGVESKEEKVSFISCHVTLHDGRFHTGVFPSLDFEAATFTCESVSGLTRCFLQLGTSLTGCHQCVACCFHRR